MSKRLLLFCSSFFDYPQRITAALKQRGYDVVWLDDRASNAAVYKAALRLFPRIVRTLSQRTFIARIKAIEHPFNCVMVVRGEGLSPGVICELRNLNPDARFSLYLWDSIENSPNARSYSDAFDYVGTFDPLDAKNYGWQYRPLFSIACSRDHKTQAALYDWSFVGTIHSDRFRVLSKLRAGMGPGRKTYIFGYFPRKFMHFFRIFADRSLMQPGDAVLSTTPLSSKENARITSESKAVADVEHPNQRGLTMRTIETLLAGRKLITTNSAILASSLYHPTRVAVIDRNTPSVPDDFFDIASEPISPADLYEHSVSGWLDQILGETRSER